MLGGGRVVGPEVGHWAEAMVVEVEMDGKEEAELKLLL